MSRSTLNCWANPSRPPRYFEKAFDFASDEELTEFVNTAIASGACAVSDTLNNGCAVFSNNSTDASSGAELQLDCAPFGIVVNGELEAQAFFYINNATNNLIRFGFAELDTTWIAGVADAVQVRVDDADGLVDVSTISNSITSNLGLGVHTMAVGWHHWYLACRTSASSELVGTVSLDMTYLDSTTLRYVTKSVSYSAIALPGQATRGNMSAGFAWIAGAVAVDCECQLDFLAFRQARLPGYGD